MQSNMAESLKLRQVKAKAFRESQRRRLDGRHKHLFTVVAERVGLEAGVVEDFMLDGDQVRIEQCSLCTTAGHYLIRCSWTCWRSCLQ